MKNKSFLFIFAILFGCLAGFQTIYAAGTCDPDVNGAYLTSAPISYCSSGVVSNFVKHDAADQANVYWTWNCGTDSCAAYRARKATLSEPVLCSTLPGWCIKYLNQTSDVAFWGSNVTPTSTSASWQCSYSGITINCSGSLGVCGQSAVVPKGRTQTPTSTNACQPGYTFRDPEIIDYHLSGPYSYLGYRTYGASSNYTFSQVWKWSCNPSGFGDCFANILESTNGSCSSTHYNCNAGTSINNLQGSTGWAWQCQGSNGGTTATCSQSFPSCTYTYGSWSTCVNGIQTRTATATNSPCVGTPTTTQSCTTPVNGTCSSTHYNCNAGTSINNLQGGQSWAWQCQGSNGGTTATCSQSFPSCTYTYGSWSTCVNGIQTRTVTATNSPCVGTPTTTQSCATPVNGTCGSANLRTYAYYETSYGNYSQCASGTSTNTAFPAQGNIVGWYCTGSNGGTASNLCAASRNTNGSCGTANGKTYAYNETSYGNDTQCATGTSNNASFPAAGSSSSWTCYVNTSMPGVNCSASRSAPSTAVCGSANGGSFTSVPTTNLCSVGTATAISGSGPWTWHCWINAGSAVGDVSCSANKITTPSAPTCGSSSGSSFTSIPTTNLCSVGTATTVTGSGPWNWQCTNPGTSEGAVGCVAYGIAQCGSANGGSFTSVPTTNLCSVGTATAISGSGPWTWHCWINAGSAVGDVSCSANKTTTAVNGSCGTAHTHTYAYNETAYAPYTQCAIGASTNTAFPNQNSIVTWYCKGSGGGNDSSVCFAGRNPIPKIDGQCGSANSGGPFSSAPTTNLCSAGTPSTVSDIGTWFWTCTGSNGGATANCSAYNTRTVFPGICGSANGGSFTSAPTTDLCNPGTATAVTGTGPWYWTCIGNNGSQPSDCSANKSSGNPGSIEISNFKNAFDLLPADALDGSQCLWCEWYEKTTLVNGLNETGTGKAGNLGFSFYYADNINYYLKTVSLRIYTSDNPSGVEIAVSKNINPASTVLFGESAAPFVKMDNTISSLTVDTASKTIKIPYDGKTYYWAVKITNTNNNDSGWVAATGKQILVPDHRWPTVAIQSATENITVNANTQICSTSAFSSSDPCYTTCWKGTGTPTLSDLANKDKWKCSVCYDTNGSPTLCQNKAGTSFSWQDGGTVTFPISTGKTWWKYGSQLNGRGFQNPIIAPKTTSAKIKLKITGSDCPFGGSISGGKISPNWREK